MGYTTSFEGAFALSRPLTVKELRSLEALREWPGDGGSARGGYCQWKPTPDGEGITWDGGEKFYDYIPCLTWLILTHLAPADLVLNGAVKWQGEERNDRGVIHVRDNEVTTEDVPLIPKTGKPVEIARATLNEIIAAGESEDADALVDLAKEGLASLEAASARLKGAKA